MPLRSRPTTGYPRPGALITRQYKGQSLPVKVLPDGLEDQGEVYKSPYYARLPTRYRQLNHCPRQFASIYSECRQFRN